MICAPSRSRKHRSSSACGSALTPLRMTPWLRTSRRPASSIARVASATSGVIECAWLAWVCIAIETPRSRAIVETRRHALDDVGLQPVLRQADQRLGGQPDVADVLDREDLGQERLEPGPRHVGDVATGDHHVAHRRRTPQVVEHVADPVVRLRDELELLDDRRGVADQVHPGAVAAVLRAGRQQLGEHLGGVAVGQPLGRPHVVLVQRVAGGVRVRGPVGAAVGEDRQHVVTDRVGVERLGQRPRAGRSRVRDHRVHHLRRHEHRHRRALVLVPLEVGVEPVVDQVAEQLAELLDVLDAVGALPLDRGPVLGGDVASSPGNRVQSGSTSSTRW